MNNVNIFRHYSQSENRYTNGLISLLKLGSNVDNQLIRNFFKMFGNVKISAKLKFKVLRDLKGTADAEVSDENSIILIETKIVSGTLRRDQIKRHLKILNQSKQKNKRLVLLTPDSAKSHYIEQFIKRSPKRIVHVTWNSVIQFLQKNKSKDIIFSELISDYVEEIKEDIFEQDISSVIVKISFGDKSGVYPDKYLDEFKNGKWTDWRTPQKYTQLDGKGKRLILYDRHQGLVLEVEIEKVRKIKNKTDYPWSNKFVEKRLKIYKKPIPLKKILKIPPTLKDKHKMNRDGKKHGFYNFDKCSTSHWNLTREQYEWLKQKNTG